MPTNMERPLYGFERGGDAPRVGRHREREHAEREREVLLDRLEVVGDARAVVLADGELARLLTRFCLDVPMVIEWYARRIRRGLVLHYAALGFCVVAAVLLLAVVTVAPLSTRMSVTWQSEVFARLMIMTAGGFALLRLLARLGDGRARLMAFWRASSDLKDVLYSLEEDWRDRVMVDGRRVHPELAAAVHHALARARLIVAAEKESFFRLLIGADELVETTAGSAEAVQPKAVALFAARAASTTTIPPVEAKPS
jgi:hypothetical protein